MAGSSARRAGKGGVEDGGRLDSPGGFSTAYLKTQTDGYPPTARANNPGPIVPTGAVAFDGPGGPALRPWLYAHVGGRGATSPAGTRPVALVVATEKMSNILDWTDRSLHDVSLFGELRGCRPRPPEGDRGSLSTPPWLPTFAARSFLPACRRCPALPLTAEAGGEPEHPDADVRTGDLQERRPVHVRGLGAGHHQETGLTERRHRSSMSPTRPNTGSSKSTGALTAGIPLGKSNVNVDRYGNIVPPSIPWRWTSRWKRVENPSWLPLVPPWWASGPGPDLGGETVRW